MYAHHGGSGFSLTPEDVLRLPFDRFLWLQEELNEQRQQDADRLKKAARKGTT
jgi:hypothetical protein